jgi:putative redox protein
MNDERPSTVAELVWTGDLVFEAASQGQRVTIDGDGRLGPSPVMALAFALAGCMGSDVAHILRKGRADLRGLRAHLVARRAPSEPRRFESVDLRFDVVGPIDPDRVARAIALSREKYCSVWHSMRQDIVFTTSFTVAAEGEPA